MIQSIFAKEFYKIRWLLLVLFLANAAVAAYVFIHTRRLFVLDHPEVVWYRVLHLGQINYEDFKFIPLLSGIVISVIQFLPEMWEQRLRICLHLPVSSQKLVFVHLFIGLFAFCLAISPGAAALVWMTIQYFPTETLQTMAQTTLPWFLAGVAAYLGGTLVLIEPNLKFKSFNMLVSCGVAGLYLQWAEPGQYAGISFWLLIPLALMLISVLLPAYRFRYRRMT